MTDLRVIRARWNARADAAGRCRQCGKPRAAGTRCEACAAANRQSAARKVYQRRRAVGPDGRRHNRCRRCQGLGHQARACPRLAPVTVEREGQVVRLACRCGWRAAGTLDEEQVTLAVAAHGGCRARARVLVGEQLRIEGG